MIVFISITVCSLLVFLIVISNIIIKRSRKNEIARVSSILNDYIKSRNDLFDKTREEFNSETEESAETIKKWIYDIVCLYGKRDLFFFVGFERYHLHSYINCYVYSNSKLLSRDEINSSIVYVSSNFIKELNSLIETTKTKLGKYYESKPDKSLPNNWLLYKDLSTELNQVGNGIEYFFRDSLFDSSVLKKDLHAYRNEFLGNTIKSLKYKLGRLYQIEERTEDGYQLKYKYFVIKYYATI